MAEEPVAANTRPPRRKSLARAAAAAAKQQDRAIERFVRTTDSYQNFVAKLGVGPGAPRNLSKAGFYGFNPISRNRQELEWAYRGSWLARVIVDAVADDMTRAGVDWHGETDPKDLERLDEAITNFELWSHLNDAIKWGRLYGGAGIVPMIDGHDPANPLRINTVAKDQLKGFLVFDRWMAQPSVDDLVTAQGRSTGYPRYYQVVAQAPAMSGRRIHHTRFWRFGGAQIPFYQRLAENLWDISVLEPLWDRMLGFDQTTAGVINLVFRAWCRTLKVNELRTMIGSSGKPGTNSPHDKFLEHLTTLAESMNINGIAAIDASDSMEAQTYSFGGLSDVMAQLEQQMAGAAQTPLVRLFGQSPTGFSTGDVDLKNYYDRVVQLQNKGLKHPCSLAFRLIANHVGIKLGEGWGFGFRSLWEMDQQQKASVAVSVTGAVSQAEEAGIIDKATAARELKQSSRLTGIFSNVSDDWITELENMPPEAEWGGEPGEEGQPSPEEEFNEQQPTEVPQDTAIQKRYKFRDQPRAQLLCLGQVIVIETPKGSSRWPGLPQLPAHYGYIRGTGSAEGAQHQMDALVGDDALFPYAFVIDQVKEDGSFDEHKVVFWSAGEPAARQLYEKAYVNAPVRIGGVTLMDAGALAKWLSSGDYSPVSLALREAA